MGFIEYNGRALLVLGISLVFCLITIGCSTNEPPDTPDIEATIAAAIAKSYPTPVSSNSESMELEVASRVQATMAAQKQAPGVLKDPAAVQLIAPTPRPAITKAALAPWDLAKEADLSNFFSLTSRSISIGCRIATI